MGCQEMGDRNGICKNITPQISIIYIYFSETLRHCQMLQLSTIHRRHTKVNHHVRYRRRSTMRLAYRRRFPPIMRTMIGYRPMLNHVPIVLLLDYRRLVGLLFFYSSSLFLAVIVDRSIGKRRRIDCTKKLSTTITA